jgi:hypothetical protein
MIPRHIRSRCFSAAIFAKMQDKRDRNGWLRMEDLLGKHVQAKEGMKKRGVIEYIDEQYIVVFWQFPRSERVIYANNETFLDKVIVVES